MNKPFGDISRTIAFVEAQIIEQASLERRRLLAYLLLLLGDMALLHLGFILAGLAYEGLLFEWRAVLQAQLLLPLFYTIALYNSSYTTSVLLDWRFAARKVLAALLISAGLLNFIAFYTKSNATFSRGSFTFGIVFSYVLIVGFRWLVVQVVRRFWQGRIRNELVIDDGGQTFRRDGADRIDAAAAAIAPVADDPHALDRIGQILQHQDRVVVSCPPERREAWAHLLKSAGVRGEIVSESAHRLGAIGVMHYDDQGRTTLMVSTGPLGLRARAAKRAFDVIVAILAIALLFPVLLWAALRIRLEDGGPVLFVQRRLGRGNRFFDMYKLRTMHSSEADPQGARSTGRGDERVTRIGRRLRRTSIDELPQLWNVLRGEMSIVGPRPHAPASQASDKLFWEIDRRYWKRHALKPGITGLAQVRGQRGSTEHEGDLADRLQSDLEYIAGWTLQRDFWIVLRTLGVLWHERAY